MLNRKVKKHKRKGLKPGNAPPLILSFLAFILRWCFRHQHDFPHVLLLLHMLHGVHYLQREGGERRAAEETRGGYVCLPWEQDLWRHDAGCHERLRHARTGWHHSPSPARCQANGTASWGCLQHLVTGRHLPRSHSSLFMANRMARLAFQECVHSMLNTVYVGNRSFTVSLYPP